MSAPGNPATRPSARDRAAASAAGLLVSAANRLPRERALAFAGGARTELGAPRRPAQPRGARAPAHRLSRLDRARAGRGVRARLRQPGALLRRVLHASADSRGEELLALAEVEGLEHFEAGRHVLPSGGAICLTAHVGSWELLVAVMAAHGIPIAVIQRPRDNPLLDELVAEIRGHNGAEMLPRGSAARAALRGLRDGKVVAMTLDQNASRREGVFVPFFGRPACTRDGPARIAMRTGAPVFPVFIERIGGSGRHRVLRASPARAGAGGLRSRGRPRRERGAHDRRRSRPPSAGTPTSGSGPTVAGRRGRGRATEDRPRATTQSLPAALAS